MKNTENQMLVIFGASGDLTARKLVPALYNLHEDGQLPKNFVVLGASRSDLTDDDFRNRVVLDSKYLKDKLKGKKKEEIEKFANIFFYQDLGKDYDVDYTPLHKRVSDLNDEKGTE